MRRGLNLTQGAAAAAPQHAAAAAKNTARLQLPEHRRPRTRAAHDRCFPPAELVAVGSRRCRG